MDLSAMMRGIQQDARELSREVSFETYLDMVRRDRRLARLSHELIHDMIVAGGSRLGPGGGTQFDPRIVDVFRNLSTRGLLPPRV